jgi:Zn-dependent peptidase ImmA (M78 family)
MNDFRRGFKAEAKRTAESLRSELRLSPKDRFDVDAALEWLGILALPFSALLEAGTPAYASMVRPDSRVSAFTIVLPPNERVFCYNDSRARTRVVSDLSHEMAHALLMHPAHVSYDIICTSEPTIEAEAAYLAGALLVTEEAAIWAVSPGATPEAVAMVLGVSMEMLCYRINVTGARRRAARRRRYLA